MLSREQAREVFESRVRPRLIVQDGGCWTISLKHNGKGYIYIRVRSLGLRIGIHVLSFLAFNEGELISALHRCDNPSCCNPEHIFSGTQAQNMKDMDTKGRRGVWHPVGEKNPSKNTDVRATLSKIAKTRTRNSEGEFAPEVSNVR